MSTLVTFHIGRGGRFHNSGHRTVIGYGRTLQDYIKEYNLNDIDENNEELPIEEHTLTDGVGNILMQGEEIYQETGCIDVDGDYDTTIVRYMKDCTDSELQTIWKDYLADDVIYHNEKAQDEICTLLGYKRVHDIKAYKSNFELFWQEGVISLDVEEASPKEDWTELLEDKGFCPHSIEKIIDKLGTYEKIEDED